MEKYYKIQYRIADVQLQLQMPWEETVSKAFRPFVVQNGVNDWQITFEPWTIQEELPEKPVYVNSVFRVYEKTPGIHVRQYYNDRPDGTPYVSVCTNVKEKKVITRYLPEARGKFGTGEADFFCIAFEKILMEENAMILHASCVDTPYGGILFSGHSGAGKSTQADLWCNYGDGRLINGDRPIIKETKDGWRAYGSPYAGSSGCHCNESCKIKAIIFPVHAETCELRELSGSEKFRKLFGNFTVNLWDSLYVHQASKFVQKIMEDLPVYEFKCTKNCESVMVLGKEMKKRNEKHIL